MLQVSIFCSKLFFVRSCFLCFGVIFGVEDGTRKTYKFWYIDLHTYTIEDHEPLVTQDFRLVSSIDEITLCPKRHQCYCYN